MLLERLRQQAKARQLKKQQEAQPKGGDGELSGGAGPEDAGLSPGGEPGEGKRKREGEERLCAQGQKKLKKKQQPRSFSEERAATEEAADGSTPSKKKENRRKSKVPQERTEAGNDKLGSLRSTVPNRVDVSCPFTCRIYLMVNFVFLCLLSNSFFRGKPHIANFEHQFSVREGGKHVA